MSDANILHKGMVPSAKALELVLEGAAPVASETIALGDTYGRVLSENLKALRTQPPFAASAMDGYAVRHDDVLTLPATLKEIGQSAAGHPFDGTISVGKTVRIFTGAAIPAGADTIVIQEDTTADGQTITILEAPLKGKYIREAGLDFKVGEMLLTKGDVIDAQSISLAASMNYAELPVYKRPRVAVLATGDELRLPGQELGDGQIIASNTFGIQAIAKSAGAEVINLGIANDTKSELTSLIAQEIKNGADLIVTSGGASVGDHDLVKPVMESLGFVFSFIKVLMRPGKPLIFGKAEIGGKTVRFIGLAGNPVSSLVGSHIFLKPLVQLLGGLPAQTAKPSAAILTKSLPANDEREDYLRGTAKRQMDGSLHVESFAKQDSSMLANLHRADCLIIRPANASAANAGDAVKVILIRDV